MSIKFLKRAWIIPFLVLFVNSPCSGPELRITTKLDESGKRYFVINSNKDFGVSSIYVKEHDYNRKVWSVSVMEETGKKFYYAQKFGGESYVNIKPLELEKGKKYKIFITMYGRRVSTLVFTH